MKPAGFYQENIKSWGLVERTAFLELSCPKRICADPEQERGGEQAADSFLEMKGKLEGVNGANIQFDAKEKKIRFLHHDREVKAIARIAGVLGHLPQSPSVLENRLAVTLGKRGHEEMELTQEGFVNFQTWKEECLQQAAEAFKKRRFSKVGINDFPLKSLAKYEGVCIGEDHKDPNPKRLLIEKMDKLFQKGVRTLFVEHLFFDSMQPSLDRALKGEKKELPPYIAEYLMGLDKGFDLDKSPYGYLALVQTALKVGIRVVGIDTTASYLCGVSRKRGVDCSRERYLGMNFVAGMIISRERQVPGTGKFMALMGINHTLRKLDVPGVAEVLEVPAVTVGKKGEKLKLLPQHPGFAAAFMSWGPPQQSTVN